MRARIRRLLELLRRLRRAATATSACLVTASAAMTSPAQAAPTGKRPILVFEAHVGQRAPDAERVLGPLRDALESHGFAARPESILKIAGGNAPRPGIMDLGVTAAAIARRIDDGYLDYTQNNFETAIKTLSEAIRLVQRNPALLTFDTGNSQLVVKAFVALANSHARLGHAPEAGAEMAELVRMYPSVVVTSASFGPEAERLYYAAWKQARTMRRGLLAITAGHPQALIFVDRQIRGVGTASLGDLIPGLYRVFIQVPGTLGRQYEVEIRPDEDRKLDVAWNVDSALLISDSWVGFELSREAQPGREALFAGSLAQRWDAGDVVAIIGLTKSQDRPVVIGTLYRTDGKVIRSAQLGLDGLASPQLNALAQYLADGTPSPTVEILAAVDAPVPVPVPNPIPKPNPNPLSVRVRGPAGAGRARWLIYGGGAALLAGLGLFVADEDPVAMPFEQASRRYWDSAPYGLAVGAVGVAAIGLGLWWSYRTKSSSRPTLSVGLSHAELGWVRRF